MKLPDPLAAAPYKVRQDAPPEALEFKRTPGWPVKITPMMRRHAAYRLIWLTISRVEKERLASLRDGAISLILMTSSLLVGWLLLTAAAVAAGTEASPPRWSRLVEPVFETLARSQGLPNDVVYSVAQDAQGFVWIGTVSGLARWDGYSARVYRAGAPGAGMPPDGLIQVLQRDVAGRLWVGTSGGGLARYDALQDRFDIVDAGARGLSHVNVHAVLDQGQGLLWVGTDGGLDSVDPQTLRVTRHVDAGAALAGLPRSSVMSLLRDSEGRLWVGTEGGLFRQRAGGVTAGFERIPLAGDVQPVVQALLQDSGGRVWIGTQQHGAFLWTAGQKDEQGPAQAGALRLTPWRGMPLQDEHVTSISELRPGLVWLATLGQGVVEIQLGAMAATGGEPLGGGWDARLIRHTPATPGSLADNTVRSLFRDRSGLLWLATDRGISRHDPTQTAVLTMLGIDIAPRPPALKVGTEAALPDNKTLTRSSTEVSWILPTDDGRLWLGTHKQGVVIVDPAGGPTHVLGPDAQRPLDALPKDIVMSLAAGPQREVYIATKRGLYRADADGQRVQRLRLGERDPAASINSLWREGETLWIGGSADGLWSLHLPSGRAEQRSPAVAQATAQAVDQSPGQADHTMGRQATDVAAADWQLTDLRITALAPGPQGTLWVGTRNGLNRIDPRRGVLSRWLPARDNPQALAGGFITAVHTDSRGRLWVGTFGTGLSVIEKPLDEPLRVRRIRSAEGLPDDNVNTLIDDAQGRVWASTDSGFALIDPLTLNVRSLRTSDGVVFPVYWTGSAARTAQGELLFGGAGGMTIVRPDAVTEWRYLPPLVLTALTVGGQPRRVPDGQQLVIPPESTSLSVEFSALDYSDPARLRYATMLQGLDSDWTETDAQHRLLSHAKLPPGDYTLLLRATNRQGVWANSPLQLPLRVLPAWYETWWARAGAVLCLLLAGFGVSHLRTLRIRVQKDRLEQQVQQRTAELRQTAQKLEQASLTDALTGVHNRRYFNDRIATLAPDDGGFALLLIDIDHFKRINDAHGHAAGDEALVGVAERLRQQLRACDHLVRMGGEEFLLVAKGLTTGEAAVLAERLRRCIGDTPIAIGRGAGSARAHSEQPAASALPVTVSIGFACLPFTPKPAVLSDTDSAAGDAGIARAATSDTDSTSPLSLSWEDVQKLADLAMYTAKHSGRNCWVGLAAGARRPADGLVQRAQADLQACVVYGELQVISQGDRDVVLSA